MTARKPQSTGGKHSLPPSAVPAMLGQRRAEQPLLDHHLVDLAAWLKSNAVVIQMAMATQGLELSLNPDADASDRQLTIDVAQGQLVLEAPIADLERLLMRLMQERARAQGVTVKKVTLMLQAVRPRELQMKANVNAGQGFLSANLEITGRVTITDTFHVRLADVNVRGQGMIGNMVALWLRPQVQQVERNEYHISSLLPGNLDIQDVRLEVDQQLRLLASLAGSSVHVRKPSSGNAGESSVAVASKAQTKGGAKSAPRKLDIFIVDTGANERARTVLERHLTLFEGFLADQNIFQLTTTQSHEILQHNPSMRGADPILLVVDSERQRGDSPGFGFRLRLGAVGQDRAAEQTLGRLLNILAEAAEAGADEAPLHVLVDVVEFSSPR